MHQVLLNALAVIELSWVYTEACLHKPKLMIHSCLYSPYFIQKLSKMAQRYDNVLVESGYRWIADMFGPPPGVTREFMNMLSKKYALRVKPK